MAFTPAPLPNPDHPPGRHGSASTTDPDDRPPGEAPPRDLGALLVAEGAISARQLEQALEIARSSHPPARLSHVLVAERMTSDHRIQDIVKAHASGYRIGELLVTLELLTPQQLDDCLAAQRTQPDRRIGEIALDREFVGEQELLRTLSYQFGMPYIEPDIRLVDIDLLQRLSVPYLRRLGAVPVHADGQTVTVVASDPTRGEIAREFRSTLRMNVEMALGPKARILATIEAFADLHRSTNRTAAGAAGGDQAENAVSTIDHLLTRAVEMGASDVHLEPMENRVRVRFRIDGELAHITDLPRALAPQLASRIKVMCKADLAERRRHQDGRMVFNDGTQQVDVRVSIYVTVHGENIVLRILNKNTGLLPMEQLGMLPVLLQTYKEAVLDVPTGVVLFTGPTGSGKTTSLYSSINYCNESGTKIITVENPVEYVMDGIVQCSIDEGAGRDFVRTLREVVRQDPDVIVVGEIRDRETAAIAIEAALTGHKVFATFHTEDSIGSLVRLIDMNIEAFLICSTVVSSIAQRLVRRICRECRAPHTPTPYEIRLLGLDASTVRAHTFHRGVGCPNCAGTGYRGRVGLYEMLLLDGQIREMVLARRPAQDIRRHALEALDLLTLQEDGIAKALLGLTTLEEVIWNVPRNTDQRSLARIAQIAHATV